MTFDWCRRRIAADNIEILKAAVLSQKERLHGLFVTHRSRLSRSGLPFGPV
jgi:hypothetical protein